MKAYVLAHVHSGQEREVVKMIHGTPGITHADFTFGPYDVIVQVEAADLKGIGNVVSEHIRALPGVIDTVTCLAVA